MCEIIDLRLARVDTDLVLIGAGIGAANILSQVKPLGAVSIDAGWVLECYESPKYKGRRAFTLPDEDLPADGNSVALAEKWIWLMTVCINPEVYVIIPNWNGREHLAYSLPSLSRATYPSLQVMMVDGCSTDDSCEYVASHFPFFAILRKSTNSGFAASVNLGIRLALLKGAKYAAIYNSDVRIPPGLFEPVVGLLEENPEIAIAGYTEVQRGDPTPICMPQTFRNWDIGTRLPGMLYVCRAKVVEDLGFYDECYYMYGEESDLFSRVLRAGYRIVQTNVPVWHHVSASGGRVRFKTAWFSYRNAIRYAAKNGTARLALRHTLAMLFYALTSGGVAPSESRLARAFGGRESLGNSGPNAKSCKVKSERYRYGHPLVNAAIWFASVCWNIIFLPQTLMARRRDASKIVRHLQTINERK